MKIIILAGGKGTRLSEYTHSIPKPMVKIGDKPIIQHIIDYYKKFKFNDFIIAAGYKHSIISRYFANKRLKNTNIKVVNTGLNSLTGTRLKKLSSYLNETFMVTYGDGLSNININKLIKFHRLNKKLITLTAVHPPARFGEIQIKGNLVNSFKEKPQLQKGWINGGFFVVEPSFLNLIGDDDVMLERSPINIAVKKKMLAAYKHNKFWYCMDTLRDKKYLENMIKEKKAPWI